MSDKIPSFAYRPRPFAPEARFTVEAGDIVGKRGEKQVRIACRDVQTVRLMFRPRHINLTGFRAMIYARNGLKMTIEDVTYKSLVEQQRLEKEYDGFIRALCAAVQKANPNTLFYAGKTPLMFALTALVGLFGSAVMVGLLIKTILAQAWLMTALVTVFGGYFIFWTWHFVMRNRPRPFDGQHIPPEVMPDL